MLITIILYTINSQCQTNVAQAYQRKLAILTSTRRTLPKLISENWQYWPVPDVRCPSLLAVTANVGQHQTCVAQAYQRRLTILVDTKRPFSIILSAITNVITPELISVHIIYNNIITNLLLVSSTDTALTTIMIQFAFSSCDLISNSIHQSKRWFNLIVVLVQSDGHQEAISTFKWFQFNP
jgi:hypothetical protein